MKSGMLCPGSVQVPLPQGHPKTPGYTIFQDTSDNWTWKTYWEQKRVTVHGGNCTRRGDWGWRGQSNFQGAWQHLRSFKNSNGCLALIRRKSERGLCFRHVVGAPKRCCLTIKQKHPKPLPPVINITYHTYDIMVSIFLLVVFFWVFVCLVLQLNSGRVSDFSSGPMGFGNVFVILWDKHQNIVDI